jgi:hypothetical protein
MSNFKKIILLNGAPSSGKDTAANYLVEKYPNIKTDKFARVLKERTHALYGFSNRAHDYYETVKSLPNDDFYGLTPRQTYINVSETYFKVHHGGSIFGQILSFEIDNYDCDILVISDSGFEEEAQVLIDKYGEDNIILIKVQREGCTFDKDSRNYIDLGPNVCTTTIINKGDSSYFEKIDCLIQQIMNG